ncbi:MULTISPECIES: divergent polysaccharide deacetylase family protein [unclassified Agarivorans]|uniref:divergent polysaccharide deacetylase family protein n=1 Tax=unclassified Agarivorans TaxID=2636026 RepID=UPI003D7CF653
MVRVILIWLSLCGCNTASAGLLSIIVDDVGNGYQDYQLLQLNPAITLSVLPASPYAKNIAVQAQQQPREVMLHLPMQGSRDLNLGPYGLSTQLDEYEFKRRVYAAIQDYPEATGLNNHMGSQLTQQPQEMGWLMQVLNEQQLFFVDSRTHLGSVAEKTALMYQVPVLRRHVFLDHIDNPVSIYQQWQLALKLSRKYGHAILIAHPRPNSLALLRQLTLPTDIQLVGLAQRLAWQKQQSSSDPNLRIANTNINQQRPSIQDGDK